MATLPRPKDRSCRMLPTGEESRICKRYLQVGPNRSRASPSQSAPSPESSHSRARMSAATSRRCAITRRRSGRLTPGPGLAGVAAPPPSPAPSPRRHGLLDQRGAGEELLVERAVHLPRLAREDAHALEHVPAQQDGAARDAVGVALQLDQAQGCLDGLAHPALAHLPAIVHGALAELPVGQVQQGPVVPGLALVRSRDAVSPALAQSCILRRPVDRRSQVILPAPLLCELALRAVQGRLQLLGPGERLQIRSLGLRAASPSWPLRKWSRRQVGLIGCPLLLA